MKESLLHHHLETLIADLQHQLDRRIATQEGERKTTEDRFLAELKAVDRALTERMNAAQVAVDKAEVATNHRLDTMNEVRDQLRDQAATFAIREVVDKDIEAVKETLREIRDRLETEIDTLKDDQQRREGAQEGLSRTGRLVVTTVTVVGTVLAILVLLANNVLKTGTVSFPTSPPAISSTR